MYNKPSCQGSIQCSSGGTAGLQESAGLLVKIILLSVLWSQNISAKRPRPNTAKLCVCMHLCVYVNAQVVYVCMYVSACML
jgi:hypothetical protein